MNEHNEVEIFVNACINGNTDIIKNIIDNNLEPMLLNRIYDDIDSCMLHACENGHLDVLIYLINMANNTELCIRSDIKSGKDKYYSSILLNKLVSMSCINGHLHIIKYFMSDCDYYPDHKAVRNACIGGNLELVKFLIDIARSPFCKDGIFEADILYLCVSHGHLHIIKFLFVHYEKEYKIKHKNMALRNAFAYDNMEIITYLISIGANMRYGNDTCLISACKSNDNVEYIKFLIENRANIHTHGDYPLIIACTYNNFNIAKCLIENGADVHAQDDQPLIISCKNGNLYLIKLLTEHGANIHIQDNIVLKNACENGFLDIVKYFVSKGMDINICNQEIFKKTCYNMHFDMADYLVDNCANIQPCDIYLIMNACKEHKRNIKYLDLVIYLLKYQKHYSFTLSDEFICGCDADLKKVLMEFKYRIVNVKRANY